MDSSDTPFTSGEATLSVSQFCALAGVTRSTLRVYERHKLMGDGKRTSGNYRQFSMEDVQRMRAIRGAKDLGFSLAEIRDVLVLLDARTLTVDDIRHIARENLRQVEYKMKQLQLLQEYFKLLSDDPDAVRSSDCEYFLRFTANDPPPAPTPLPLDARRQPATVS